MQCSEDVCIPEGYSSSSMPRAAYDSGFNPNITSMKIMLEFTDVDILEVSDIKHTITIKMHLGVHWNEPRLVSLDKYGLGNQEPLDIRILEYLWLPDLDIWKVKDIKEFKVLKKLAGMLFKYLTI